MIQSVLNTCPNYIYLHKAKLYTCKKQKQKRGKCKDWHYLIGQGMEGIRRGVTVQEIGKRSWNFIGAFYGGLGRLLSFIAKWHRAWVARLGQGGVWRCSMIGVRRSSVLMCGCGNWFLENLLIWLELWNVLLKSVRISILNRHWI